MFALWYRAPKLMLARFLFAITLCAAAISVYSEEAKFSDFEQADSQSCIPPDDYTAHPGDPPFGVYVQATARFSSRNNLLGILYCEDGTFEFVGSDPRTVSLDTTIYRTGRWWWEGSKSCTQIDASETDTEIPTARCKEARHWLGDHKVMVPTVSKHIDQPRSGVNSLTNRMISRPVCTTTRYAANSDRQRHAVPHSGRCP